MLRYILSTRLTFPRWSSKEYHIRIIIWT